LIAWVEGVLRDRAPTRVIIDVSGVGYELSIPLSTFGVLPDPGKTVSLHVHTHARESAIELYGFATQRERALFELLLRANRVGPRLAQTILSGISAGALLAALQGGDAAVLRRVPGVGAKLADKMIVDLRDRAAEMSLGDEAGAAPGEVGNREVAGQVLSALLNLGYPRAQAERVVDAVAQEAADDTSIESWIRIALRRLA
jgi:Holliday junction DNA helicase RuvA